MVDGQAKAVALLHDVVEDTDVQLADLAGFGPDIVAAVDALTRRDGEPRDAYLRRVMANGLARTVNFPCPGIPNL